MGILQGALAGHRPRNPVTFDTRHNCFGVLSANRWRIFGSVFCVQHREMNHVKPDHAPMPAITEAVSSQRRLAAEDVQTVRTAAFVTSPFFHVSRPQRLSPLASPPTDCARSSSVTPTPKDRSEHKTAAHHHR